MTQGKDENSRYYFKKMENKEILPLIQRAFDEKLSVTLWPKGNESKAEQYKISDFDSSSKWMTLQKEGSILSKLKASPLTDKESLIKFSLDRFHYFSTTTLKYDPNSLEYTALLNGDFFLGQQRANFRFKPGPYNKIRVRIKESIYDCSDISAGGLSLLIKTDESKNFSLLSMIEQLKIQFDQAVYEVPRAKVVMTKAEGELVFVALQFAAIDGDVEAKLSRHVSSEARGEEIRRKLLK